MPYVNIHLTKGATRAQKAQLVKEVTDSLVRILGKKPEHTHIVALLHKDDELGVIMIDIKSTPLLNHVRKGNQDPISASQLE